MSQNFLGQKLQLLANKSCNKIYQNHQVNAVLFYIGKDLDRWNKLTNIVIKSHLETNRNLGIKHLKFIHKKHLQTCN